MDRLQQRQINKIHIILIHTLTLLLDFFFLLSVKEDKIDDEKTCSNIDTDVGYIKYIAPNAIKIKKIYHIPTKRSINKISNCASCNEHHCNTTQKIFWRTYLLKYKKYHHKKDHRYYHKYPNVSKKHPKSYPLVLHIGEGKKIIDYW